MDNETQTTRGEDETRKQVKCWVCRKKCKRHHPIHGPSNKYDQVSVCYVCRTPLIADGAYWWREFTEKEAAKVKDDDLLISALGSQLALYESTH